MSDTAIDGYRYGSAELNHSHDYLLPCLEALVDRHAPKGSRLFDLGCGNGSVANAMVGRGYVVTGIDASSEGIAEANARYPGLKLEQGSAYDALSARYGTFPLVYSLEVVEHVYSPRDYADTLADLIEPSGLAVISTPYHGYWKNLAMAVTGKMDAHFTALWDHGHIKFWSVPTLTTLLSESGLKVEEVHRVGRIPALAKSMVVLARKVGEPTRERHAMGIHE